HHAVPAGRHLHRHVSWWIARMRKRAAGRNVKGVYAATVVLEDVAYFECVFEGIARTVPWIKPTVVVDAVDLHLQVEITADLLADRVHDLKDEARPLGDGASEGVAAIVDTRA